MTKVLSLIVLTACMLTPQVSRADSEPAPVVAPDALPALLARHAQDPRVEDIVREALAAYGADPTRLSSMASRARLRGLIPNVELGARRGQGMDLKPATSADVEGLRLSTDDNLVLEATLRFELGRLLFADDEVGIAREARAARSSRDDLVRQIVELYFKRKRLLLERDLRGSSDIDHEVRIAEAEALLDAFTNGAFRRMLVARKTAWTTDAPTHVTPSR